MRRQLANGGGLAGLSGVAGGDVRDMESAAASGSRRAQLALEVFAYQVRRPSALSRRPWAGWTPSRLPAGSEKIPRPARALLRGPGIFGDRLDSGRNESGSGDRVVSAAGSRVAVLALSTNEELIVARRAYRCLAAAAVAS